jgi:hypothetical protein
MTVRRMLPMAALLCALACSHSPTTPASAAIDVRANPASTAGGPCSGCGTGSTDRESQTTLTIQETAGIGGDITSIAMVLTTAGGQTIAQGAFDAAAVASLAGTAHIAANGSLSVTCGVHYAASSAGAAATLTYTVRFKDEHGNQLSHDLSVPVNPT